MAKKIFGKRTLAMVLVLVMCFSMFQMTAQAARFPIGNDNSRGHIHLQMSSSSQAQQYKQITVYFTEASGMPTATLSRSGSEWVANGSSWYTTLGTEGYTLVDHIVLVKQDGSEEYRSAASAKCQDNTGVDLTLGDTTTPLIPVVVQVYYEQNYNQNDFSLVKTDTEAFAAQQAGTVITLTEAQIAAYGGEGYAYVVVDETKTNGQVPADGTLVLKVYFEIAQDPTPPTEPSGEPTEPSSEPTEPSSEPTEPTLPAKYTVTYVYTGNVPAGAPSVPAAASYEAGEQVRIAQAPTLKNYTFSGWDKKDFTMPAEDVIIRGSWTENPKYDYAVTYNANFGSNPAVNADSENISGIYATSHSVTVDSNRFVRSNYTFIGWNTEADGSGKAYKAGEVIALTAENNTEVLYAQWQENPKYSYTVQYNENYGAHPMVYRDSESISDTYATGYSIGVDANGFTRPNYTFIGWNTEADGSGKEYKAGQVIALTAENNTEVLYAQWQENPKYDYAVIYHANFGAGQTKPDSQNVTATYANPYTIGVDRNSFVRPNYTFIGWAEAPEGDVVYQAGDSILFTDSGKKDLYAKWIEHNKYSFTLIYNGNGGALTDGHIAYGDSENAEGIYDNHLEITVDENTFVREGYTFIGWNTKPDGTGIPCAADGLVALTARHNTMTLYAQWQEIPKYDYAVTYNANYGEEPATRADDQNVAGVYSTALNFSVDAEEFAREGYTFTGWNTEADGTGKAYAAGDVIALTAEENTEILYAQWIINEYAYTVHYVVRLDANPYAAFQGQLPENAPVGGKAVHGAVIDETTLQLPATITDGVYTYSYTAIDGIVIPFGSNTVIVYYSAVSPIVEIPEVEIPLVQPPANEPAPVNPGSDPAPTTPSAPLVELPDEEVPLADAPKTGDAMTLYIGLTALSGMGLLGLGLTKKKEEEN